MVIDVLMTTSSRFNDFRKTIKSFLENVECKDGYRLLLHEDVRDEAESKRITNWAEGTFEEILISDPFVGRASGFRKLLDLVNSTYFVYLEQDWEFNKLVNLDKLRDIMARRRNINQIAFSNSRYIVKPSWSWIEQGGLVFTISKFWYMSPSLCRKTFTLRRMNFFMPPNCGKTFTQSVTAELGKFKLGVYALGEPGEYVKHIGPEGRTEAEYL